MSQNRELEISLQRSRRQSGRKELVLFDGHAELNSHWKCISRVFFRRTIKFRCRREWEIINQRFFCRVSSTYIAHLFFLRVHVDLLCILSVFSCMIILCLFSSVCARKGREEESERHTYDRALYVAGGTGCREREWERVGLIAWINLHLSGANGGKGTPVSIQHGSKW